MVDHDMPPSACPSARAARPAGRWRNLPASSWGCAAAATPKSSGAAPALIEALGEVVPAAGEVGGPPIIGLYPLELEGEIDFFVGIERGAARAVRDHAERVQLIATRVAVTTHIGPYEELQLAYFPLLAYARERGLAPAAVVRETYVDDPAVVGAQRVRTEVARPFESPLQTEEDYP